MVLLKVHKGTPKETQEVKVSVLAKQLGTSPAKLRSRTRLILTREGDGWKDVTVP
jgi:hypothetical protein